MTGKDLLEILMTKSEEELDLEVRLFTDHGQSAEPAHCVDVDYIESGQYGAERIAEEDIEDLEPEDYEKVLLIQ